MKLLKHYKWAQRSNATHTDSSRAAPVQRAEKHFSVAQLRVRECLYGSRQSPRTRTIGCSSHSPWPRALHGVEGGVGGPRAAKSSSRAAALCWPSCPRQDRSWPAPTRASCVYHAQSVVRTQTSEVRSNAGARFAERRQRGCAHLAEQTRLWLDSMTSLASLISSRRQPVACLASRLC